MRWVMEQICGDQYRVTQQLQMFTVSPEEPGINQAHVPIGTVRDKPQRFSLGDSSLVEARADGGSIWL